MTNLVNKAYVVSWDNLDNELFFHEKDAKRRKFDLEQNGFLRVEITPLYTANESHKIAMEEAGNGLENKNTGLINKLKEASENLRLAIHSPDSLPSKHPRAGHSTGLEEAEKLCHLLSKY